MTDIIPVSNVVAKSTTEAEYVAMHTKQPKKQSIIIRKLLADLINKADLPRVLY